MVWFNTTQLPVSVLPERPVRIAQITDCHLLSENGTYHHLDTRVSLQRVIKVLAEQHWDAVMVTGDITQDHTSASYQILADFCQQYLANVPVAWLPGNHDELDCLNRWLSQPPFVGAKHLKLGRWHVLMLNSKGPTPAGVITQEHLIEIKQLLDNVTKDEPVAVFCHHHLLPVNGFIDRDILTNGESLLNLIKSYRQVKWLAHGHVHQQKQTIINRQCGGEIQLLATPSTSVQFKPNSFAKGNDDLGPGFRWFELYDNGHFTTDVTWLEQ
jgi:Icc protein